MAEQNFLQTDDACDENIPESDVAFDECMLDLSPDEHKTLYSVYKESALLANMNADDPATLSLCARLLRRMMRKFPTDDRYCFLQLHNDTQDLLEALYGLLHNKPTQAESGLLLKQRFARLQTRSDALFISLMLKDSARENDRNSEKTCQN